ncbi:hypothetical protein B0I35DRAFT_426096 [Stachybotrys elegans]|uniref:Uncharacterized protein n=1 Tax=Stachybotrys elegans TaxID=80388 RepID=A0A8K0SVV2_9HYPO|nr:hypothetical protein B0I35DRAFT_426096 [Stachybotrys elegans]
MRGEMFMPAATGYLLVSISLLSAITADVPCGIREMRGKAVHHFGQLIASLALDAFSIWDTIRGIAKCITSSLTHRMERYKEP